MASCQWMISSYRAFALCLISANFWLSLSWLDSIFADARGWMGGLFRMTWSFQGKCPGELGRSSSLRCMGNMRLCLVGPSPPSGAVKSGLIPAYDLGSNGSECSPSIAVKSGASLGLVGPSPTSVAVKSGVIPAHDSGSNGSECPPSAAVKSGVIPAHQSGSNGSESLKPSSVRCTGKIRRGLVLWISLASSVASGVASAGSGRVEWCWWVS